jgi:hypothetical protein
MPLWQLFFSLPLERRGIAQIFTHRDVFLFPLASTYRSRSSNKKQLRVAVAAFAAQKCKTQGNPYIPCFIKSSPFLSRLHLLLLILFLRFAQASH